MNLKLEILSTGRFATLRRSVVLSLIGLLGMIAVPGTGLAQAWQQVEAVRQIVGTSDVLGEGLELTLPLVAEDGSSVPVSVVSAASVPARITRLALFAPNNPTPEVAVFEFGEDIASVNLSTRIRLSESQTVVAVAQLADGRHIVAERPVRVTVSGCVAPAQSDPASELKARVRVPEKLQPATPAELITMVSHPMITGLAKDADGNLPAQRIIQQFRASLDERVVLQARFFRSLAANPYLKFEVAPAQGGTLQFEWVEDTGRSVQLTEEIRVS